MEASETSTGSGFVVFQERDRPQVSIVVPAFNEASRIGNSIAQIDAYISRSSHSFELIVVDDGSSDRTAEIVRSSRVQGLRLFSNDRNHGKGYTVRQGVLSARGEYVLFTDADLSAPIEELDKLFDVAAREGADIVVGSRAVDPKYIEKHQSSVREFGGKFFNLMVRLVLGLQVHDTQCGFKLFHRERCRRLFEQQRTFGFCFDAELLYLAKRSGLTVRETPVRWSHAEGSKVRLIRDGLRMFLDLVRIRWNALRGRYV
jgi:glycosyltransferase involved in cell wall biosynthesis